MFHIIEEGTEIKNGFNFYPLSSKCSVGGKIRIHKLYIYFRYSKVIKKFFFNVAMDTNNINGSPTDVNKLLSKN